MNQSTILVIIKATPKNFFLDFENNWWFYAIVGLGLVVVIAAGAVSGRRKKKEAYKKTLPEVGYYEKKEAPSYQMPTPKEDTGDLDFSLPGATGSSSKEKRASPSSGPSMTGVDRSFTQEPMHVPAVAFTAPAKVDFYCQACKETFEVDGFTGETWYNCPNCMAELALMKKCSSCGNTFAVRHSDYERYKGKLVPCPVCKRQITL